MSKKTHLLIANEHDVNAFTWKREECRCEHQFTSVHPTKLGCNYFMFIGLKILLSLFLSVYSISHWYMGNSFPMFQLNLYILGYGFSLTAAHEVILLCRLSLYPTDFVHVTMVDNADMPTHILVTQYI